MRAELLVLTNAVAGEDAAFNAWYDGVHLGEVCAVPGVCAARRSEALPGADVRYRYSAIYEIDTDDPGAVVAEIKRRYNSGEMATTPALAEFEMALYAPRTAR